MPEHILVFLSQGSWFVYNYSKGATGFNWLNRRGRYGNLVHDEKDGYADYFRSRREAIQMVKRLYNKMIPYLHPESKTRVPDQYSVSV